MAFITTFTTMIVLAISFTCGTGTSSDVLINLYNGIQSHMKVLQVGRVQDIPIIPFKVALNCASCSSDDTCVENCQAFYRLMYAVTEIHSEYQKLQALRSQDENSDDLELQLLEIIMNQLSMDACTVLTSTLPTGSITCTYSDLIKLKTKLELFFAVGQADTIIRSVGTFPSSEAWIKNIFCDLTADQRSVVQMAHRRLRNMSCPTSS